MMHPQGCVMFEVLSLFIFGASLGEPGPVHRARYWGLFWGFGGASGGEPGERACFVIASRSGGFWCGDSLGRGGHYVFEIAIIMGVLGGGA